jgi:uncharacterized membrane protein
MIHLAIGLGLLGFIAMRRARRCHGYGGCGSSGYHSYYGRHHHGRRRWMLNMALAKIDASPAQERAIIAEVEKLQERVHAAKGGLKDARGDLSAALRGPVLDDAALGAVLGRVDGSTAEVRTAVLDALRAIHALLDDRQRAQLADLLGGSWRHGGPYRM